MLKGVQNVLGRKTSDNSLKDAAKPKALDEKVGSSGVTTRSARRPLGDITNANPRDAVKKPTLVHVTSEAVDASVKRESTEDTSEPMEEDDRSYMRRDADDIDSRDSENPLLCTEYVMEMYENFKVLEVAHRVDHQYMATMQPYVNEKMRAILVDWLVEVHLKFKMVPETLYLTVSIIDRYLCLKQVRRSRLQLVGVSALLVRTCTLLQ
jgi:cyclin B